ncbi:MAG: Na/Pi symporter, partial [bacterium]|nr:Na/Pi symporter [bacterium]
MNLLLCILLLSGLSHLTKAKDPRGNDISGDGMVVTVGRELPDPIIIELIDDNGEPVEGVPVELRFISVPPQTEEEYVSTILTDTTDVRGYAIFKLYAGNVAGQYWLEASSPILQDRVKVSFIAMRPHFVFFLVIGLLGGFALFMYGLNFGSKALTRVAGGKLRDFLWRLTKNPVIGVFVGMFITILTQSSSATTVMLVSFAEAGLVNFIQTLGVILGASLGTTLTVQLIAFKVFDIALIIVAIGFFMMIFAKRRSIHYAGRVIFAFGLIFFGMKVMTDAVYPLTLIPGVTGRLIAMGERPFLLLILSAVFTGIVQSSGATMAIVISFAFSGLIGMEGAIPIIFGANIGTCVTALLASIGRGTEAKRVAMAHIMFKIFMVIAFFPFIYQFATLIGHTSASLPRQVANAHTFFNLVAALVFLPFLIPYSRLIARVVPQRKVGFKVRYLDSTLLSSPAIA